MNSSRLKASRTQASQRLGRVCIAFLLPRSVLTAALPTWLAASSVLFLLPAAFAFEGRITATFTQGTDSRTCCYTVGTNEVRIECGDTNRPLAKNIITRDSGAVTLVFPHNRSFVRLTASNAGGLSAGADGRPPAGLARGGPTGLPISNQGPPDPGRAPQLGSTNLGGVPEHPLMPPSSPGQPAMPVGMPAMPMRAGMPTDRLELQATDQTTNLLGYVCARYELKQRGEIMEIWATDKLLPFQPWLQNQPHHFGPKMMEEQWGDLLKSKKLFPLIAILRFENGVERLRFEVTSIKPEKIEDPDGSLFHPPQDYREVQPLPF